MGTWNERLVRRQEAARRAGLERKLRTAEGSGVRLRLDGRELCSFASNDYLGLSTHPQVLAAARAALEIRGAGAGASRLICGSKPEHAALESDLAAFKRTESALVFSSGYHAALATLGALGSAQDESEQTLLILDRLAHACLLDGARLSGARLRTFKHNQADDLERVLEREKDRSSQEQTATLVVVESLYSMDGDLAPLQELYAVCRKHGAWILVDEAHATGVLGPGGRGALAELFPQDLPPEVLSLGTLSKALGSQGGFLCASRSVTQAVVQSGRALLFSTALAPASAAAARAALEISGGMETSRSKLLQAAENLRARWKAHGLKILGRPGPILPILVGEEAKTLEWSERLLKEGLWVPAVRFPTVKRGQARLRACLSAAHTEVDLRRLEEAVAGLK